MIIKRINRKRSHGKGHSSCHWPYYPSSASQLPAQQVDLQWQWRTSGLYRFSMGLQAGRQYDWRSQSISYPLASCSTTARSLSCCPCWHAISTKNVLCRTTKKDFYVCKRYNGHWNYRKGSKCRQWTDWNSDKDFLDSLKEGLTKSIQDSIPLHKHESSGTLRQFAWIRRHLKKKDLQTIRKKIGNIKSSSRWSHAWSLTEPGRCARVFWCIIRIHCYQIPRTGLLHYGCHRLNYKNWSSPPRGFHLESDSFISMRHKPKHPRPRWSKNDCATLSSFESIGLQFNTNCMLHARIFFSIP